MSFLQSSNPNLYAQKSTKNILSQSAKLPINRKNINNLYKNGKSTPETDSGSYNYDNDVKTLLEFLNILAKQLRTGGMPSEEVNKIQLVYLMNLRQRIFAQILESSSIKFSEITEKQNNLLDYYKNVFKAAYLGLIRNQGFYDGVNSWISNLNIFYEKTEDLANSMKLAILIMEDLRYRKEIEIDELGEEFKQQLNKNLSLDDDYKQALGTLNELEKERSDLENLLFINNKNYAQNYSKDYKPKYPAFDNNDTIRQIKEIENKIPKVKDALNQEEARVKNVTMQEMIKLKLLQKLDENKWNPVKINTNDPAALLDFCKSMDLRQKLRQILDSTDIREIAVKYIEEYFETIYVGGYFKDVQENFTDYYSILKVNPEKINDVDGISSIICDELPYEHDIIDFLNNPGSRTGLKDSNFIDRIINRVGVGDLFRNVSNEIQKRINKSKLSENWITRIIIDTLSTTISNCDQKNQTISQVLPEYDRRFAKAFRQEYLQNDGDFSRNSLYYSNLNSLISMLENQMNAYNYESYEKNTYRLNESRFFENNNRMMTSEVVNYYKPLKTFFSNAVEILKKYNQNCGENQNADYKLRYNEFRNAKTGYGMLVINLFKQLLAKKFEVENKIYGYFKHGMKGTVSYAEFNNIYENYIKLIKNRFYSSNLEDIEKYTTIIGRSTPWGGIDREKIKDKEKTIPGALNALNSILADMVSALKNNNHSESINTVLNMVRLRAIRDLMTFKVLKQLVQPMIDVINFDFGSMCTDKREGSLFKFEIKDIKDKNINEILKSFIESYLKIKKSVYTERDFMFINKGMFLDLNDQELNPKVAALQKLMEQIYAKLEEMNATGVKEAEDKNEELEEEKEPETPISNESLEMLSKSGGKKRLLGHDNGSITPVECEYSPSANGSGVDFELQNCPEYPDRAIFAVPVVNGAAKPPAGILKNRKITIPDISISNGTWVHFYYNVPGSPDLKMVRENFIGAIKLHDTNFSGKGQNLKFEYLENKNASENYEADTIVTKYGDKIVVQFPEKINVKDTLFIGFNSATGNDAHNLRNAVVTTKEGKSFLIIDDPQVVNLLGSKDDFEIHLYSNRLDGATYIMKLKVNNKIEDNRINNDELKDDKNLKQIGKKQKNKNKNKAAQKRKESDIDDEDDDEQEEKEKNKDNSSNILDYFTIDNTIDDLDIDEYGFNSLDDTFYTSY